MSEGSQYFEISAGDQHLCSLRVPLKGKHRNVSLVDCWGYNMTKNHVLDGQTKSISAGSEFNCGLFVQNKSVFCWGDETSSRVISLIPKKRFQRIAAGGYHVCGILEGVGSRAYCWGTSLGAEEAISYTNLAEHNVDFAPSNPMLAVVGGKFHACGIKSYIREVVCWGYLIEGSIPPPKEARLYGITSGDYFTCGVLAETSLRPVYWGSGLLSTLPLVVSPGFCKPNPCVPGYYEFNNGSAPCRTGYRICLPCSESCPAEMYQIHKCTLTSDRQCGYNCSDCTSAECHAGCSSLTFANGKKNAKYWSLQLPVIIAEVSFLPVEYCIFDCYIICSLQVWLRLELAASVILGITLFSLNSKISASEGKWQEVDKARDI